MESLINKTNGILDNHSQEKARELIPVSVYVMILMIIGLPGNILVCIFYGFKTKVTPTTRLIIAVALIDIVVCASLPKNVVELSFPYKFKQTSLCKLNQFVNHIAAFTSVLILVVIAVFRYRLVLKPCKNQFNNRNANIAVIASVVVGCILSVPALIIFKSTPITIDTVTNVTVIGHICNSSKESSILVMIKVVNGIYFLVFISTATTLFVLYGIMGRTIWKYYKRRKILTGKSTSSDRNEFTNTSGIVSDDVGESTTTHVCLSSITENDADSDNRTHTALSDNLKNNSSKSMADRKEQMTVVMKQTVMVFLVSFLFVLSYLPYLALVMSRNLSGKDYYESTVWMELCRRSYIINSSFNPFVYGLFNSEFKQYARKALFCKKK